MGEQRHAVSTREAVRRESAGGAIDSRIELAVGVALRAVDECGLLRAARGTARNQLADALSAQVLVRQ